MGGGGGGGQGRCEWRSEVFVKISCCCFFFWGGGGGGVSGRGDGEVKFLFNVKISKKNVSFPTGLGGQGRCEQRSEVFVKIQKKKWGGGLGWGGGRA